MKYRYSLYALALLFSHAFIAMTQPAKEDLVAAINANEPPRVAELIRRHPHLVHAIDEYYGTALHLAMEREHAEIANLLVDAGSDVNNISPDGKTPLLRALNMPNNIAFVAKLLERKANPNIANTNERMGGHGVTPLMRATLLGQAQNVNALLEVGAQADTLDMSGRRAQDYVYVPWAGFDDPSSKAVHAIFRAHGIHFDPYIRLQSNN